MTTMIRNPYLSPFQSLLIAWGRHISGKASNRKRHSLCKNVRQDKCLTAWFPPMHQVECMDTDGIHFCIRSNEVRILRTTKQEMMPTEGADFRQKGPLQIGVSNAEWDVTGHRAHVIFTKRTNATFFCLWSVSLLLLIASGAPHQGGPLNGPLPQIAQRCNKICTKKKYLPEPPHFSDDCVAPELHW